MVFIASLGHYVLDRGCPLIQKRFIEALGPWFTCVRATGRKVWQGTVTPHRKHQAEVKSPTQVTRPQ